MNGTDKPAGFPALGLSAAAAGLAIAALAVAERAGLPGTSAWAAAFVLMLAGLIAVIALARTGMEWLFLGRSLLAGPAGGGVLLGGLAAGLCYHLVRPVASADLVSTALGTAAGIMLSSLVARRRGAGLLVGEAGRGEDGAPSLIQGLLIAGAGLLAAAAALPAARDAVMLLTGWSPTGATALVLALPLAAIATAGMRGLLALSAGLLIIIGAGLALAFWLGVTQLGALPLPGFTQADTLLAIAGARTRLFQADTLPFVVAWLPQGGFRSLIVSLPFAASLAITALVARALSPGVSVGKAGVATVAAVSQALILFGLAAMAGYAVEAAGLQFVGASLQAPPAGLLEASRQGLAEFCGQRPQTLDGLRTACGLAPRAQGQLALERIRLMEPFLWTGVPVSLGVPAALAAPARLGPVAFPLLGVTAGLWLAALGLGRGVLGRGRIAPGLASHRLGLVRLAALAGCIVLALTGGFGGAALWQPAAMLALIALSLDVIQQGLSPPREPDAAPAVLQRAASPRKSAAPRDAAQSA